MGRFFWHQDTISFNVSWAANCKAARWTGDWQRFGWWAPKVFLSIFVRVWGWVLGVDTFILDKYVFRSPLFLDHFKHFNSLLRTLWQRNRYQDMNGWQASVLPRSQLLVCTCISATVKGHRRYTDTHSNEISHRIWKRWFPIRILLCEGSLFLVSC